MLNTSEKTYVKKQKAYYKDVKLLSKRNKLYSKLRKINWKIVSLNRKSSALNLNSKTEYYLNIVDRKKVNFNHIHFKDIDINKLIPMTEELNRLYKYLLRDENGDKIFISKTYNENSVEILYLIGHEYKIKRWLNIEDYNKELNNYNNSINLSTLTVLTETI